MDGHPILLFDDGCGVCHWAVRFVLRHDRGGCFRFAALGSTTGQRLMEKYGVDSAIDSLVLFDGGTCHVQSGAVFRILRRLGGGWRFLAVFALLPRHWCDVLYDGFARRRSRISRSFGLSCSMPRFEDRGRFLD
ncbi:MAG: thiol-disulfide oxidoreductase DCC family protein [Gemmatimonadales bacterium]